MTRMAKAKAAGCPIAIAIRFANLENTEVGYNTKSLLRVVGIGSLQA
jgi:hypothetical protein